MVSLWHNVFLMPSLAGLAALPKLIVPNLPDLTVRTRQTFGDSLVHLKTLYVKGARQRIETALENPSRSDAIKNVTIHQCDEKRVFHLNERDKIYVSSEIEKRGRGTKARPVSAAQASGTEVTVTIDSADTGERRQYGNYTARRVKVEIRFEPGHGAVTPASVEERNGWYIDVPGFGCREDASQGFLLAMSSGRSGSVRDRLHVKRVGNAPRGYPIEETTVTTQAGSTTSTKTELLEISEAPVDPSLFELPSGYRRALQTGRGGTDLTKPDTIYNRVYHRLRRLTSRMHGLLRQRRRS